MKPPEKKPFTDEMRSLLMAEILGDVGRVNEQIEKLGLDLQAISQATQDQAQDLHRWGQVLDQKILELNQINFSAIASERLAQHAGDYLRALSKEVSVMVAHEVRGQALAPSVKVHSSFGPMQFMGCVVAVLVGNLVWAVLSYLAH